MEPVEIEEFLVNSYLVNPYSGLARIRRRQVDRILQDMDLGELSRYLQHHHAEDEDDEGFDCLMLALGHYQACLPGNEQHPERVLTEEVLPRRFKSKGKGRERYLPVVMAAARSEKILDDDIAGQSQAIKETRREVWASCFGESLFSAMVFAQIFRDHNVLITGETGTGKELVARAIQAGAMGGQDGSPPPAVSVNAAAIPENLVESTLFGHVKGAFTDATDHKGKIMQASGGSIFIDEIAELPMTTQVKLLRVIETDEVDPLGASKTAEVQLRYVAATNNDPGDMFVSNSFRPDLYHRLAGAIIRMPPLRERLEDIDSIFDHFKSHCNPSDRPLGHLVGFETTREWLQSAEAQQYHWPGNVRELLTVIRRLLIRTDPHLERSRPSTSPGDSVPDSIRHRKWSMHEVRDWYMKRVLEDNDNNYEQAARVLKLNRSTVRRHHRRMK